MGKDDGEVLGRHSVLFLVLDGEMQKLHQLLQQIKVVSRKSFHCCLERIDTDLSFLERKRSHEGLVTRVRDERLWKFSEKGLENS